VAGIVLILLGAASIFVGANGRSDVRERLADERIVGSPDMTPEATAATLEEAGLTEVEVPDCSVAGEEIDTGERAEYFAE
jgi:hypothetical protein